LKWTGSAYLVYLGASALWKLWQAKLVDTMISVDSPVNVSTATRSSSSTKPHREVVALLRQGWLSNVFNPKVMIFFIAFLPQFVYTGSGAAPVWTQLFLQGLAFSVITGFSYAMIAVAAERVGRLLQRMPAVGSWIEGVSGATFIAMGAWLALSDRK
jgi:threonine/homoserine/homoserine lactone efflux protein